MKPLAQKGTAMTTKRGSPPVRRSQWPGALLAALLGSAGTPGLAQQATEMFIPMGQSSGLSGKHTLLARVQAVSASERSFTLVQDAVTLTVRLGAGTPVWVDRSKLQQPNSVGTLADVTAGALVEVKFQKNSRATGQADWVKVQAAP
jgi:hypothetical protein